MPYAAPELKTGSARRLRPAAALVAAALAAAGAVDSAEARPAQAATAPASSNLGYKFYVGGVLIGKAQLKTTIEEGRYVSRGSLKTDGVAGWFLAAQVTAQARGVFEGRQTREILPGALDVSGVTDEEPWRMSIVYTGDAPALVTAEPPFRKKHYEIDPARQNGALDPISAIVATLTPVEAGRACNRVIPIFDGRKRYDIVIGDQIDEGESDAGYPTVTCDVVWKRVGGFKEKQMAKEDVPFSAEFEIRGDQTVPRKLWADTEFGGAVAVLRR